MNPQMIAKIREIGFEVTEKSGALIKVSLPKVPAKEKMIDLFGALGPEDEILFENFYPSGIPKGKAYVTAIIHEGKPYFRDSCTGFESSLYTTTLDDMACRVTTNWDKDPSGDGLYKNCIYIRHNPYPYRELRTTVFLPDIKFDGCESGADRLLFTGGMMMLIGVFFFFAAEKTPLQSFLAFFIVGLVFFIPGLLIRIPYNITSRFWRWEKRVDKRKKYKITMTLNGNTCELKDKKTLKQKLDEFYSTNGRYDIEVDPPMAGIAAYSAYYDTNRNFYVYTFKTITDDKVTYRYFSCIGRSREDLVQITNLLKRKRISLRDYGFEKSWEWENPMIEFPHN